jgi:hypothetical protein
MFTEGTGVFEDRGVGPEDRVPVLGQPDHQEEALSNERQRAGTLHRILYSSSHLPRQLSGDAEAR